MKLVFLGTGTSHGVPVIGCECEVCKSKDARDRRYRCSAYITSNTGKNILIDIGPEFRLQAIENHIKKIDALLLTHSHADHLHGIDDIRSFSCDSFKKPSDEQNAKKVNAPPIPIYTNHETLEDVKHRFSYFFIPSKEGGGHAKVTLNEVSDPFEVADLSVTPIPMQHGHLETVGWLLTQREDDNSKTSIAYLTDCNYISDESIEKIHKNCGRLEHLIIDGLRVKEHSTHFNFLQALDAAQKIGANHVWLIHLTHNLSHIQVIDYINEHLGDFPKLQAEAKSVLPAYDGLEISC
ncbi:MAG: MBL fold metallo-hydrolase [Treponema sp.]|nr:MBL fold metallo-hydrolase [Treponema sp.]